MKSRILFVVFLILCHEARTQSLVINEVAYSNKGSVTDSYYDSPDWFEIYNNSDHAINLADFKITDDTSKAESWVFPEYNLLPGNFKIIFCSGRDTLIRGEFHTGFRLSNMRETLFLLNHLNEIVDEIHPVCVPTDHTRARKPDGSGILIVTLPTPGVSNNASEALTVNYIRDSLSINNPGGFYESPVSISLSHLHSENNIAYTLNGDVPDDESSVYDQPFTLYDLTPGKNRFANIPETDVEPGNLIFKANILRAMVISNGCPASNEIVNTYFISEAMRGHYPVPIVSLITEKDNLFDDETGIYVHGKYRNFDQHGDNWERLTHVEIFDSTGQQIIDQDAGMRIHGRGSRRSPQKSLRLYAREKYGEDYFRYAFFHQKPEINKFNVLLIRTTGGTLGPIFKEELCNYLVQDMNIDYPAGETAILFINGEYWGIYNLMERQNEHYIENNYHLTDVDADIIAYDREIVVEEGSGDEYNNLVNQLRSSDPSAPGFYAEMQEVFDIDAMIDYYIAQLFLGNTDWPLSNVELWKIRNNTAKWRYFFFDSDATMVWLNEYHLTENNNFMDDYQRYPEFCTLILKTMMQNEDFRKKFYQQFWYHLNTTFRSDRVLDAINYFERRYAPLVPEHIYRWHKPVDYLKWEKNVDGLRSFAFQRPLFIAKQLHENFGNPVIIYPNPCRGNFNVALVIPEENFMIRIYGVDGHLLESHSFTDQQEAHVNVYTALPPGMYIMQFITGDNYIYKEKLIIR